MGQEQPDFFLPALVGANSLRDDQDIMSYPFFALQKRQTGKQMEFRQTLTDGSEVSIRIKGNQDGIATIWDQHLLIYLHTVLVERMNRGDEVSPIIRFTVHDFLKTIRSKTGKPEYDRVLEGLRRLKGTTIETNIEAQNEGAEEGVSWINRYRVHRRKTARGEMMAYVEVELSSWVFQKMTEKGKHLSILPDYFNITSGIEKRLYQIARKHVGNQPRWHITLDKLYMRVGSQQEMRNFKVKLSQIIRADSLLGYTVDWEQPGKRLTPQRTLVVFRRRDPRLVHAKTR